MTYQPQRFAAPDGTELVVLAVADYERLRTLAEDGSDSITAGEIRKRIDDGEGTMPGEVLSLILDEGLSPLAAWRRHRALSQAALARRAGLSQVWVGRIEAGGGYGSRETRRKLGVALNAPVWTLEEQELKQSGAAKPSSGKGSKYRPLGNHLLETNAESVTLRFAEISEMVGGLPKSASLHRPWWANHEGNSQAVGWMGASYLAEPDMAHQTVTFRRSR